MLGPKGSQLFVNIGASQARRRLKGFGHGVRKVQSGGRNKAVITHTATGQHLTELERKFADVGFSVNEGDLGEPIENLRNLGSARAKWLRDAGISSIGDLERIGPALAYRLVKQNQPDTGLNLLWALAAGLENRDSRDLTDRVKSRLCLEAETLP